MLPYLSKAARERENWRTLPEIVAHICRVDGCGEDSAQQQIREALADGKLIPLRWEDRVSAPHYHDRFLHDSDDPPGRDVGWRDAEIDFEAGTVLEFGFTDEGRLLARRRTLLVPWPRVEQWWPDREAEEQAAERSRSMEREAAARAFDEPFWPTARVLRWLAWCDPALIEQRWEPAWRYDNPANPAFRGNPQPKLLRALQEGDLRAIKDGEELLPDFWSRIRQNQLPDVDFRRKDLQALWPPLNAEGAQVAPGPGLAMSALNPPWAVVPPPILARDALNDTIEVLRRFYFGNGGGDRSRREEIELVYEWNLTDKAIACLRAACAAGDLTMVVFDERTHSPHAVPAAYFDQRPAAELEFGSSYFGSYELPQLVAADPLFKFVRCYRGWVHGFIEADFRAWLGNADIGPLAGPRMRPFFHSDPNEGTYPLERAEMKHVDQIGHPTEQAGNEQKAAFLAWMETQKQEYGTYPPADCRNKVSRPGWRNWATENHVARERVRNWRASNPDFLIRRGRPHNSPRNKNSTAELSNLVIFKDPHI